MRVSASVKVRVAPFCAVDCTVTVFGPRASGTCAAPPLVTGWPLTVISGQSAAVAARATEGWSTVAL